MELLVVYGLFAVLLLLSVSVCVWCLCRRRRGARETASGAKAETEDAMELNRVASTSTNVTMVTPSPGSTVQSTPNSPGAVEELNLVQQPEVPDERDDAEDGDLGPGSAEHSTGEDDDGADGMYSQGRRATRKE